VRVPVDPAAAPAQAADINPSAFTTDLLISRKNAGA
jgi:hypothetical protein